MAQDGLISGLEYVHPGRAGAVDEGSRGLLLHGMWCVVATRERLVNDIGTVICNSSRLIDSEAAYSAPHPPKESHPRPQVESRTP